MILFKKNKKGFKKFKREAGFLMAEVLVAASIMTVSTLAAMYITQKSVEVSNGAVRASQAAFLLEEGAEVVRILRDNGWSNITSLTAGSTYYPLYSSGSWTLSGTPNTVGVFTRTVSISNVNRDNTTEDISANGTNDPGTKLVTVTVTWQNGGTTSSRTLSFYIMDIFS